jgi:hypothetical protein
LLSILEIRYIFKKKWCSKKNSPVTLKIRIRLIKFLVTRIYLFARLTSSFPSLLAQIVCIFVLADLSGSHNNYNIVAPAIFVQPVIVVVIVVVVVVVQLLHICKFFFEVVCSLIINYTELYYFKRSSITHKVFFNFLYQYFCTSSFREPKNPRTNSRH